MHSRALGESSLSIGSVNATCWWQVSMVFATGVNCTLTGCCLSPTPRVSCLKLVQDECVCCQ